MTTPLNLEYDSLDDIPDDLKARDLFEEKDGKFVLSRVAGVSQLRQSVSRLEEGIRKERNDHKALKDKFAKFAELGDPEELQQKLERYPELEAAAEGKIDDAKLDEIVNKRYAADRLRHEKRQKDLETRLAEVTKLNEEFAANARRRNIHDEVRSAATEEKLLPTAIEDALLMGERVMEVAEDGTVVTRDGVGVTPGLNAREWLGELRDKRPHWWPGSKGTGATGSGGRSGISSGADNPWSPDGWNVTKQGQMLRTDRVRAEAMAKAAGQKLIGGRPPKAAGSR